MLSPNESTKMRIDIRYMHMRDSDLLRWLRSQFKPNQIFQMPAKVIAHEFQCCDDAALAMMRRLIQGGYLRHADERTYKGGRYYELLQ